MSKPFELAKLHGKAMKAGKKPSDFDPKQVAMGVEVEKEHTDDPDVAKTETIDHLTEFRNYYTGLKEMEDKLKKQASVLSPETRHRLHNVLTNARR